MTETRTEHAKGCLYSEAYGSACSCGAAGAVKFREAHFGDASYYWNDVNAEAYAKAERTALLEALKTAQRSESFWVVERFENGKSAGYWDGASSRSFQFDISKAIQFRRKEDAFWATRGWHWKDVELTEHLMMAEAERAIRKAGQP